MPPKKRARQQVQDETTELKIRLEETEETLHAIRQYLVDAFVVNQSDGVQVVTLNNADFPYRIMVESMNEGAVTVIPDGTIFYCNPRFAEMAGMETEELVGTRFQELIPQDEQNDFEAAFKQAKQNGAREEFCLQSAKGSCLPVQLSFRQLDAADVRGISIIVTDISERVQSEEQIRLLASKLTFAEEEERQRISQILHDDLQQRLFAIKAQLSQLNSASTQNPDSSAMQKEMDQIQLWLSDAISMTRNLSIDLNPVALQGESLTEIITRLCSQMKEQYGLQVSLDAKGNFDLFNPEMRLLLFQAIREALFNIVKHAGTLQATVTMEPVEQHTLITISDAGNGFDAVSVMNDPNVAHGLLLIENRLKLMHSRLKVTSKPGNGTRVAIEVWHSGQ